MNLWEKFANKDAEYYILSYKGIDYSTSEGQQYFYKTGQEMVELLLNRASRYPHSRESALEIGCGIGRLTLPHAGVFKRISAVDVSPTMLAKLKANARERNVDNIQGFLPDGEWDKGSYDYVYSFIVFQHIQDFNIIRDYIARISRCLRRDGIIQIQFDTRPAGFLYKMRNLIPDLFLPKDQRKGIRRIRRTPGELRELFRKNDLEILEEFNQDDENHTFIMRRS